MSQNTGLSIDMKLMLQGPNDIEAKLVTIINKDEYVTVKYKDNSIKTFLPVYDSGEFHDIINEKIYKFSIIDEDDDSYTMILTLQEAISDPSLHNIAKDMIWIMIMGSSPPCNCHRCISRQIRILESRLRNIPDGDDYVIAAIFISEVMLPSLNRRYVISRILNLINEIDNEINEIDNDQDELSQSMLEGGNVRHAASESTISKMTEFIKPFDKSVHGKDSSCVFCLETFEDITKDQNGVPPLVLTCQGCEDKQTFCAGSKKEGCCKGFLGQMEVDHRCPLCRKTVRDWEIKKDKRESINDSEEYTSDIIPSHKVDNMETKIVATYEPFLKLKISTNYQHNLNYITSLIGYVPVKEKKPKKHYPKFHKKVPYKIPNKKSYKSVHRKKRQFYGAKR